MPSTYTLISSNVLTGSAASVTFSAIPSTYTDLVIRLSSRSDGSSIYSAVSVQCNSATSTYSATLLYAAGGSPGSIRYTAQTTLPRLAYSVGSTSTSNTFSNAEIYIPNYALTTSKPVSGFSVTENNNATDTIIGADSALWSGTTAAITSLTIAETNGNFVSGSSFYLYGIKNS